MLPTDRKSTRLNSSHSSISYAVFCLKKKINFFIIKRRLLLKSTLFPYTTLFRSLNHRHVHRGNWRVVAESAGQHVAHRSEEHTSELQSQFHLVCRLLLEKKNKFFYYKETATTEIYTLSLHDALPIS